MASSLPIGDFSRATHMSIKTLRHYHRVGLLEPAEVDQFTGHRRYTTEQIPTAQVIRRFRELDMPLEEIRAVLTAPDVPARNELIAAHLGRLEEGLARTQSAVAALRDLLERPAAPGAQRHQPPQRGRDPGRRHHRRRSTSSDAGAWYQGALGELHATVGAQDVAASRAAGRHLRQRLVRHERGEATVFIPCAGPVRPVGRVEPLIVPPAELAIIVHDGPARRHRPGLRRAGHLCGRARAGRGRARSASTTCPAGTTPPTSQPGGPRSAGRSSGHLAVASHRAAAQPGGYPGGCSSGLPASARAAAACCSSRPG